MNFRYYKTVPLIILILTIGVILTPISQHIEGWISSLDIEIINKIYSYNGIFSTVSLISLMLLLIDKYLWKCSFMKWLIDIPNLNGRYEGELVSSYRDDLGNNIKKRCIIEIKQTASEIKIFSYYSDLNSDKQTSCSYSVLEEIISRDDNVFKLYYVYDNKAEILNELSDHSGTCILQYYSNEKKLEGEYYNARAYKGNIKVSFKEKKLKGKL